MLEMTSVPPASPSPDVNPQAARAPPNDDFHDTVWAQQAEEEEKEKVLEGKAAGHVDEAPTSHDAGKVTDQAAGHEKELAKGGRGEDSREGGEATEKEHLKSSQEPPAEWNDKLLRSYLEPIEQSEWEVKPLPNRTTAHAEKLEKIEYPKLTSCKRFAAQFPIDEYPDADPFLPWIHDVFPTHDGKYIQFVAQNKRRCRTGTTDSEKLLLAHFAPQAAIFQHVAVKRLKIDGETRYQLSNHEDADPDGLTTRFICRFKPSMEETLSTFNVDYDYAAYRKAHRHTFSEDGHDIKSIYTSQLLFQCPVPKALQEIVRTGASVKDDFATLFVDIVPMRTPVRYGKPNKFFPPWYHDHRDLDEPFDTKLEWGNHVLPRIEDSGRWENIPICAPSLHTYKPAKGEPAVKADNPESLEPNKLHRLSVCTWTSAGYHTRGGRFQVNDGARRLREWVHFNQLVGVEHFYIYDNSGAHTNDTSLQAVADLFPDSVTIVEWPSKVCNNNPNNVDSPGERSSQYAAEASCRLRFGPYTDWLGGYDVDEYISPLGKYNSLIPLLDKLDQDGTKMINFRSWRSWPRRALIEEPVTQEGKFICKNKRPCFELRVPENVTVLQTYNCDRQKGTKKQQMPAEKQIYRPDYVKLHFVHYSTVTTLSAANKTEYDKMTNVKWHWPMTKDNFARFSDEINEGAMLHSKAMATPDTAGWETACKNESWLPCRIGFPYPEGVEEPTVSHDANNWTYNCFVNQKIEKYYVPLLEEAMKTTQKQYDALSTLK